MIELALVFIILGIAAITFYVVGSVSQNNYFIMLATGAFIVSTLMWILVFMANEYVAEAVQPVPANSTATYTYNAGEIATITTTYEYEPMYADLQPVFEQVYNVVNVLTQILLWGTLIVFLYNGILYFANVRQR